MCLTFQGVFQSYLTLSESENPHLLDGSFQEQAYLMASKFVSRYYAENPVCTWIYTHWCFKID